MVEELLRVGQENALKKETLCDLLDVDVRKLRRIIAEERQRGAVILFSPAGGYYKPENDMEVEIFIKTMSAKAASTFKAVESAKKYLDESSDQIKFI